MKNIIAFSVCAVGLAFSGLAAEACYRSVCAPEPDGTVVCINDEVDCGTLSCLDCSPGCAGPDCTPPFDPYVSYYQCLSEQGRENVYIVKDESLARDYEWNDGGLTGFGADGGSWERRNFYSAETRDWDSSGY